MNDLKMRSSDNGLVFKGNMIDVCYMLGMEQQKYGKISLSKYLKEKKERLKAEADAEKLLIRPSCSLGN